MRLKKVNFVQEVLKSLNDSREWQGKHVTSRTRKLCWVCRWRGQVYFQSNIHATQIPRVMKNVCRRVCIHKKASDMFIILLMFIQVYCVSIVSFSYYTYYMQHPATYRLFQRAIFFLFVHACKIFWTKIFSTQRTNRKSSI